MAGPWEQYAQPGPWERYATAPAAPEAAPNPTEGMSTFDKVAAGIGKGMVSVGRAVGLGGLAERFGLPATKEEAERLDAPLMETTSGKVGNFIGTAAPATLGMLIPGANTVLGATAIGAGTGLATTEGDLSERVDGAIGGGLGGAGGVVIGKGLGAVASKFLDSRTKAAAAETAKNAVRDATLASGREAGYVVTPSQAGAKGTVSSVLEGWGGKTSLQQTASTRNADVTNRLARQAVGLPDDAPLTHEALDAIRKQAGTVYRELAGSGPLNATGARLPAGVRVDNALDPLTLTQRGQVDSGAVIEAWKQANADASAWFRAAGRSANPEDLAKARSYAADAKALGDFIETSFPDRVGALRDARQLIAKTHTVENALTEGSGNVSARKLAAQLTKGRPLSGELKTAAQFAQTFPKATQDAVDAPAWSVLDMLGGGTAHLSGLSPVAAMFAARPAARSAVLSPAAQRFLATPSYGPGPVARTAAPVLNSEIARRLLGAAGIAEGQSLAIQP